MTKPKPTVGDTVSYWVRERKTDVRTGHVTAVDQHEGRIYVTNLFTSDVDEPVWGTWLSDEAFFVPDWPFQAVIEP